ncbi:MAG TPA: gamma-glutamyl-gamma-aminobutyrate hydrolase family protein [Rhodospirillales bacterium]|nr:gamma-glutamyl-gamma-aminobutyrate hydrolase family protein [Rhodospirillales bacterium]
MDSSLTHSSEAGPPLIGVSGCRKEIIGLPFDAAGSKYVNAIAAACRAVPVIVPALGHRLDRQALLNRLDGLLFTGSPSNVEPHHYQGPASDEGTLHDADRDATTLPLILEAVAAGVPVFCICRGFQEFNVAFGGTLHQKVQDVPGLNDHREDPADPLEIRYGTVHEVALDPHGLIAGLAGSPSVRVNSLHGQGIDTVAPGLRVEATAPDGLIEAISAPKAESFALAVQWHPEWQVMDNPFYLSLFTAFAEACRVRAARMIRPTV